MHYVWVNLLSSASVELSLNYIVAVLLCLVPDFLCSWLSFQSGVAHVLLRCFSCCQKVAAALAQASAVRLCTALQPALAVLLL
jgi:hypothetical protein